MKALPDKKIIIRVTGQTVRTTLLVLLVWSLTLWGAWQWGKAVAFSSNLNNSVYNLLNPRLQSFAYDTAEERRSKTFVTLSPLKIAIFKYVGDNKPNVSFYVEDLNTGAWVGWQEREQFVAASLLKVPLVVGAMKKVDQGDWNLTTTFQLESRYKDKNFGSLWQSPDGTPLTLKQLVEETLQYSDNTAANIIFDKLSLSEREDVYYHIGLSNPEAPLETTVNQPLFRMMSAKDLASMFRGLYNATYLTRQSSNYILEVLTQTKFDKVLATDIPPEVRVAHKIANFFTKDPNRPKNFHDCGISYVPEHPYLYCVMTKTYPADVAQGLIVDIGNKIYRYFASGGETNDLGV